MMEATAFSSELEFRILGPLELLAEARPLELPAGKVLSLLGLLLLRANELVPAERLLEELWEGTPPRTAATALQGYVSQLRKLLEPEPSEPRLLLTRAPGYLLSLAPEQLDRSRFERLAEAGEQALRADEPQQAASLLAEALSLWRGPALGDFRYERWAQAEAARLEELRLAALERRFEAELALGRHASLVSELEPLVAEYPLRERLRAQLMLALYRSGRQAEALEHYQQARAALVEQLGIEPAGELQALERSILRQEEGLEATLPQAAQRAALPAAAYRWSDAGRSSPHCSSCCAASAALSP